MNKATWTGLQRGSSMSRFLLVDSLVAVGSSVLLYVDRIDRKRDRKEETRRCPFSSLWRSPQIRRDAAPRVLRFFSSLPSLLPPAPFRSSLSLCHLYPFAASLLPLYHSVFLSLPLSSRPLSVSPRPPCLPLALLDFSSTR